MNKKYFLLVGLLPLFYSCANKTNVNKVNYQNIPTTAISEEDEEADACTVMYVGKDVSTNGKAIIARSSDAGPGAMSLNVHMFPPNSLANQIVTSNKGFSYKMPSRTYRYISTPRSEVIHKGNHWEASAINEKGVGVSATLSCYCNEDVSKVDPLVEGGLSEDNIAQIVGATASTAREGIEIIAKIIDEQGAQDGNAIMTIDQNEAWYMEIYSGHQYAAVKCPDDKILTAGNEFVFDSLDHMNIPLEDTILSGELLTKLANVEGEDKRKFDDESKKDDVRHLKLAETYSVPLTQEEEKRITNDGRHRRTWRGYSLFAKTTYPDESIQKYSSTKKYDAFYKPGLLLNDEPTKLDIHDVTKFMRDRFEDILEDKNNPNNDSFGADNDNHNLRYIAIENAYQIHIIQSDKNLPADLAATEWLSVSNANYSPFIPFTCGADRFSSYYAKTSPTFSYDEGSATNIFKKLNTLARTNREYYGINVENFWKAYELIWDEQYYKLVDQIKDMDLNSRYEIMDNFTIRLQENVVKTALFMIDDLTWHMMNDSFDFGTPTDFEPCVNVKDYAKIHGYSYNRISNTVNFAKANEKYSLVLTNQEYRPSPETKYDYRSVGEISYGDVKETIDMVIDGEDVYVPLESLTKYIKGEVVINAKDYRNPFNHAVWIIPTVIIVPIIGGLSFHFINKRRKEDN